MSFDPAHILVCLVTSGLGYIYFSYGRKLNLVSYISAGVALMGYSYFVTSMPWLIGIGIALALAPRFLGS